MRVTQGMMVQQFLRNIKGINEKLILSQYKLARGVNYSKPSDGPLEIGHILSFSAQENKFAQLQKNITNGLSNVQYVDILMQSMVTRISDVRTSTVHGADGSLSPNDRAAIALEVDQLLQAMLEDGQSKFRGVFLFSGHKTLTKPFNGVYSNWDRYLSSVDYLGDLGNINRRIGDYNRLPININGKDLFMEKTYTLKGNYLPTDRSLGFSGKLTIDKKTISVRENHSLNDIRDMINNTPGIKVRASTDNGYLKLESGTSSDHIQIFDNQGGKLLDNLGLNLRGAFNRGITGPTLPVVDSTGAIFDAAGPVANLVFNSSNNVLNIHLGPSANDGVAASKSITIPEGTYADVDELVAAIQTEADNAFGKDKVIVENNGGALQIRTTSTGADVGTADLRIGGEVDDFADSASGMTNLNLVALPDPVDLTDSTFAGTDGTDKFYIDLGDLASRTGEDIEKVEIDLRADFTGTLAELIDEINYQISHDLAIRGIVKAREDNGRLVIETTQTGSRITADQLQITDSTTGTIAGLGFLEDSTVAYIDGIPPAGYPLNIVTGLNDTIVIDLGPSVSRNGINHNVITMKLTEGSYADINALVDEINIQFRRNHDLLGSIVATVEGNPGLEYIRLASTSRGSIVEGEDLVITGGTALADLGLSTGTAVSGGGVSSGRGIELLPQNIFNTMIKIRDSLLDYATGKSLIKELMPDNGNIIEIFEGDQITLEAEGRSFTFTFRATDTLDDLVRTFNDFLGSKAEVRFDRSGRLIIDNLTTQKIAGLKISAVSPEGQERTSFNNLFRIDSEVLGLKQIGTDIMKHPLRHQELGNNYLGAIDKDMENFFKFQSFIGATTNRLERTSTMIMNRDFNVKTERVNLEGANIAEVIMELSQQEAILQAALNVGSRILTPSLLQYLR